jgi:hypothetical protein
MAALGLGLIRPSKGVAPWLLFVGLDGGPAERKKKQSRRHMVIDRIDDLIETRRASHDGPSLPIASAKTTGKSCCRFGKLPLDEVIRR